MRWRRGGRSENIEDRRGSGRPTGRGGLRLGLGGVLVLFAASVFLQQDLFGLLGVDPSAALQQPRGDSPVGTPSPQEDELVEFVSFVLDDAQTTWAERIDDYRDAKLVLFRGGVRSGCGNAQAAMGPFYCPADQKLYIDLAFYEELRRRFGAPGDFAQAYVLAHELGHHLQNLLGIERQVRSQQAERPSSANALSVRMELQADCFAGVWAHSTQRRDLLEPGDLEEGMAAAAAVGDDRIQEMSGGRVNPEGFTHGSSEQRVRWFRQGLESGDPNRCDTFANR